MATGKKTVLSDKMIPVLLVVTIVMAFAVGALWQKVTYLEDGSLGSAKVPAVADDPSVAGQAAPPDPNTPLSDDQADKVVVVTSEDHVKGSLDARVFLIEYSDFECPFCQRFHPTAQQVIDEYGDDVAWVFRHFPLTFIHSRAQPAAEAAECVAELAGNEAFWVYTEQLFEGGPENLDDDSLTAAAGNVGVSEGDFESCLSSGKFADKVSSQSDGGTAAGITGTPGTIIMNQNGDVWLVPGAVPYEQLKTTIDQALAS